MLSLSSFFHSHSVGKLTDILPVGCCFGPAKRSSSADQAELSGMCVQPMYDLMPLIVSLYGSVLLTESGQGWPYQNPAHG